MQCKTCGREISDTAKFCPYCGSKTEPPHNSAENKTAETAYESPPRFLYFFVKS